MTVNERLWVSGLMSMFDKAVAEKNIEEITRILNEVGLFGDNVTAILKFYSLVG